ncbi:MAG: DUF599 family protein, partial [Burkholderiales bacterium]
IWAGYQRFATWRADKNHPSLMSEYRREWWQKVVERELRIVDAAPSHDADPQRLADYVSRAARIATLAADNFNYGLRAYYFGLAALSWFLNSWIFMCVTAWVVGILYAREFRSKALQVLTRP